MVAVVSGLNNTTVRRLKRTWDQLNPKYISMLAVCEAIIHPAKNFANYRAALSAVTSSCVPYIGALILIPLSTYPYSDAQVTFYPGYSSLKTGVRTSSMDALSTSENVSRLQSSF